MALSKVQSMMKGGKSIDSLGSLYDDAFSLYGKFEGAADFQGRHRSLELVIVNGTSYDLEHVEEYFATGTSYEHIKSVCIEPGTAGLAFVTNRQGKVGRSLWKYALCNKRNEEIFDHRLY